jgi:hypothetical protein
VRDVLVAIGMALAVKQPPGPAAIRAGSRLRTVPETLSGPVNLRVVFRHSVRRLYFAVKKRPGIGLEYLRRSARKDCDYRCEQCARPRGRCLVDPWSMLIDAWTNLAEGTLRGLRRGVISIGIARDEFLSLFFRVSSGIVSGRSWVGRVVEPDNSAPWPGGSNQVFCCWPQVCIKGSP